MAQEDTTREFVVSECWIHGWKVAPDYESFLNYIDVATECAAERKTENLARHLLDHAAEQVSCWVCCNRMIIDPMGIAGDIGHGVSNAG